MLPENFEDPKVRLTFKIAINIMVYDKYSKEGKVDVVW